MRDIKNVHKLQASKLLASSRDCISSYYRRRIFFNFCLICHMKCIGSFFFCSCVLASSRVAVSDSVSKTEKGPAGRHLDVDSKLTSELKTQESSIPEKRFVSAEVVKIVCFCVLC